MKSSFRLILIVAILFGFSMAWIDTRPNWDDTGVEIFLILVGAGLLGFLAKQKPWLVALATGIWIPLYGVVFSNNFGGIIALLAAFIGSFGGYLLSLAAKRA